MIVNNDGEMEMIHKYIKKETNFQIDYDSKGNAIFIKKKDMRSKPNVYRKFRRD